MLIILVIVTRSVSASPIKESSERYKHGFIRNFDDTNKHNNRLFNRHDSYEYGDNKLSMVSPRSEKSVEKDMMDEEGPFYKFNTDEQDNNEISSIQFQLENKKHDDIMENFHEYNEKLLGRNFEKALSDNIEDGQRRPSSIIEPKASDEDEGEFFRDFMDIKNDDCLDKCWTNYELCFNHASNVTPEVHEKCVSLKAECNSSC